MLPVAPATAALFALQATKINSAKFHLSYPRRVYFTPLLHHVAPCCTMLHHVAQCCTMLHHSLDFCGGGGNFVVVHWPVVSGSGTRGLPKTRNRVGVKLNSVNISKVRFLIFSGLFTISLVTLNSDAKAQTCIDQGPGCIVCVDHAKEHPGGGCTLGHGCSASTTTCGHP